MALELIAQNISGKHVYVKAKEELSAALSDGYTAETVKAAGTDLPAIAELKSLKTRVAGEVAYVSLRYVAEENAESEEVTE